ncbi:hypothetical protein [Niabella hibiscisoli]|nr:hypothetical protein [Niabella hibiscisoli]MCH5715258.1 hypothetical protein [Niabella hibiscisoli]
MKRQPDIGIHCLLVKIKIDARPECSNARFSSWLYTGKVVEHFSRVAVD